MINYITSLKLINFRNHIYLAQEFGQKSVVIIGENGIGKTNILESISLLAPGRGLRSIKFEEIINNNSSSPRCKASLRLNKQPNFHEVNLELFRDDDNKFHKNIQFDGSNTKKFTELLTYISIIWLTPQMDQIVSGPSSERRKFFDRIVFNFYPQHAKNINYYEKLLRERSYILKTSRHEKKWLEAIEQKIVEYGLLAGKGRIEVCDFIQEIIYASEDEFPQVNLRLENDIEEMLTNHTHEEVADYFRKKLHDNRENDFIMHRTNTGIHRTDLLLYHKEKNIIASNCSTGEQKALLVNLILAQAYGLIIRNNSSPILLLDEIVAHLDEERRKELFKRINKLGLQSWMTGTERDLFTPMESQAEFYNLSEIGLKQIEYIA
jgi:DNA replication and repair protein RecF